MRDVRPLILLACVLAATACREPIGNGGEFAVVAGRLLDAGGAPVEGGTIRVVASGEVLFNDGVGEYRVQITDPSPRVVFEIEALGYAPQLVVVERRPGVTRYWRDVTLVRPQTMTMSAGGASSMDVDNPMGPSIRVRLTEGSVPSGAPVQVSVAAFTPQNGPADMRTTDEPGQNLMQSYGMFRVDVRDLAGAPVELAGEGLMFEIGAFDPELIEGSGPIEWFELRPGDARWESRVDLEGAPGALTAREAAARRAGYWNCDRTTRTACITGTVVTASGRACGGTTMRADGPAGISSYDSPGSDGAFCLEGASNRSSTVVINGASRTFTMPSIPGNCATQTGCIDVGTIVVADESDCPTGCFPGQIDTPDGCMDPPPPPTTGPGPSDVCEFTTSCSMCSVESCGGTSGGYYRTSDGAIFRCDTSSCEPAARAALSHCGCI